MKNRTPWFWQAFWKGLADEELGAQRPRRKETTSVSRRDRQQYSPVSVVDDSTVVPHVNSSRAVNSRRSNTRRVPEFKESDSLLVPADWTHVKRSTAKNAPWKTRSTSLKEVGMQ